MHRLPGSYQTVLPSATSSRISFISSCAVCPQPALQEGPWSASNVHFACLLPSFFPPSFLSLFPPFNNSRCPAFSAKNFSVTPTSPAELLCLILFCEMILVFFGLITRAPGFGPVRFLSCCQYFSREYISRGARCSAVCGSRETHVLCTTGFDFVLTAP
jgi:hypothetical protein